MQAVRKIEALEERRGAPVLSAGEELYILTVYGTEGFAPFYVRFRKWAKKTTGRA